MIATASKKAKRTALHQVVIDMNKTPVPKELERQFQNRLRLPEQKSRRLKLLYDKAMNETITPVEEAELDTLMDLAATMDLIRAYALFGSAAANGKRPRK